MKNKKQRDADKKKGVKEKKVELQGWRITETMKHRGNYYTRIDCCDDGLEWYRDGDGGDYEFRLSNDEPELVEKLEAEYQKSKQGYPYFFQSNNKK
jgi:hypothetical protein